MVGPLKGVPVSPGDFKKLKCRLSLSFIYVDFKKWSCRPVEFKDRGSQWCNPEARTDL